MNIFKLSHITNIFKLLAPYPTQATAGDSVTSLPVFWLRPGPYYITGGGETNVGTPAHHPVTPLYCPPPPTILPPPSSNPTQSTVRLIKRSHHCEKACPGEVIFLIHKFISASCNDHILLLHTHTIYKTFVQLVKERGIVQEGGK